MKRNNSNASLFIVMEERMESTIVLPQNVFLKHTFWQDTWHFYDYFMQPARLGMTAWRQPIFIFITKSSFTSQYFLPRIKKSKRIAMINHNVGERLRKHTTHTSRRGSTREQNKAAYFLFMYIYSAGGGGRGWGWGGCGRGCSVFMSLLSI